MDEKLLKNKIKELYDKYYKIKSEGRYNQINEETTKIQFINPLFEALGWDIRDKKGESEVSFEETIGKGRVDYVFRINGVPKFILEAKPLRTSILDKKWIEQTINYAFNKGITWAILCNYENIWVFNAEGKHKDWAGNRFLKLYYENYLEEEFFEYLTWLSRDSIEQGILDKKAETFGKKIKKTPIDEQLLTDFTKYRDILTKDIFRNNKPISPEELDEVVQRIFDRLIFIRTCEDKEIEPKRLESAIRTYQNTKEFSLNKKVTEIFQIYNRNYDSELFESSFCDQLKTSNAVLERVILGMHGPEEGIKNYDFSVIDANVLGTIYEQYLGHILRTTLKRAKLANGKVHRKEQGIYYTPTYIVDYIVRNTLGERLKKRGIKVDELKILDPACGSGSFLLRAFDTLAEYVAKKEGKAQQTRFEDISSGKLLKRKTELMKNTVFGVDLDPKAVEITRLNLLLKLAEKRQRLPTLQENIICGNSLIDDPLIEKGNYFRWDEAFPEIIQYDENENLKKGYGFDVIIGNPPYITIGGKEDPNVSENHKKFYSEKFKSYEYKANYFSLFIEKGISLLNENGCISLIVPRTLLDNVHMKNLREYILDKTKIKILIELKYKVFEEAETGGNVIFILQKCKNEKEKNNNYIYSLVLSDKTKNLNDIKYSKIKQSNFMKSDIFQFLISDEQTMNIINKIEKNAILLGELCSVGNGVNTGNAAKILLSNRKENKYYRKILEGKDINRYNLDWHGLWVNYDPSLKDRIDLRTLDTRQKKIDFSLRKEELFNEEKIILRQTADRLIGTFDNNKYISRHSTHIIRLKNNQISLKYILGLFNSTLLTYYYRNLIPEKGKAFAEVKAIHVKKLPIKTDPKFEKIIVDCVDKLLTINKKINVIGDKKTNEKLKLERERKKIDKQIDSLVYNVYGLTKEEINIIEESLKE